MHAGPAGTSHDEHADAPPHRWLGAWAFRLAALASFAVVVAAVLAITHLRATATDSRLIARRSDAIRLSISQAESVSWQSLGEAAPDFTFEQRIRTLESRLATDGAELRRSSDDPSARRVVFLLGFLSRGLREVQGQIAEHNLSLAHQTALDSVTGTAALLDPPLAATSRALRARADASEGSANAWSLVILAAAIASVVLLSLLARRARAARRAFAEEVAGRTERRLSALVQNASEVIVLLDEAWRVTYVTPSGERLFGHPPSNLHGRGLEEFVAPTHRERLEAALARVSTPGHTPMQTEWPVARADGRSLWVEAIAANLIHDPDVGAVVITLRDVTERHEMQERLRHQAFHDALTGLANRALFEDRVAHALDRSQRVGGSVTIAFIDLDDFKTVNDSLGHAAGDRLLRVAASRIHEVLRPSDTAARLGGDEFAVLFDGFDLEDDAVAIAERIGRSLAITTEVGDREVAVRASIGLAHSRSTTTSGDDLIRDADIALYASKEAGKGRVTVFEPPMLAAARQRLDLRQDLRLAIERGELRVAYQPLVDLASGSVHGLEALLRWDHPIHGSISPASFIPIADETGLIHGIGRWVLQQACAKLAELRALGHLELRVSVNVSAVQLTVPGFSDVIRAVLARTGVPAERLVLELTESALIDDEDGVAGRLIAELRALGVKLSVDDFGTGYSTLAYVQRLAVDSVKIDRSFVAGIEHAKQSQSLVRAIIELGHTMDLQVVAEGVESSAQHANLTADGCDLAQGYLYSEPVAADEVVAMLDSLAAAATTAG